MVAVVATVMLIMGVLILVKGKLKVSKKRVVKGGPAYLLGCLFLAPLSIDPVLPILLSTVGVWHGGIPLSLEPLFESASAITELIAIVATIGFVAFARGDPPGA